MCNVELPSHVQSSTGIQEHGDTIVKHEQEFLACSTSSERALPKLSKLSKLSWPDQYMRQSAAGVVGCDRRVGIECVACNRPGGYSITLAHTKPLLGAGLSCTSLFLLRSSDSDLPITLMRIYLPFGIAGRLEILTGSERVSFRTKEEVRPLL
jgi:hypothetical protein